MHTKPRRFALAMIAALCALLWLADLSTVHAQERAPAPAAGADLNYKLRLPFLRKSPPPPPPFQCPATSARTYQLIPVPPPVTDRPAAQHADLNLALRGYQPSAGVVGLVDYNGGTDPDAPQLAGLFPVHRIPTLTGVAQVYHWDWGCGPLGCRAGLIDDPVVTLLRVTAPPSESLSAPERQAEIYGGGYKALVLYAEERRITLKYTREDNVVYGYTVHLEDICVDAALLALYRQANAAGRGSLPALRNNEPLGVAPDGSFGVVIRDTGNFMDPRSRKDWWQGMAFDGPILWQTRPDYSGRHDAAPLQN